MSREAIATKASELSGLHVHRLSFESKSYYDSTEGFTGKASFRAMNGSYNGMKEVELELPPAMAGEIMRLLAPVLAQQAAVSAQKLADQAKELANEVSRNILMVTATQAVPSGQAPGDGRDDSGNCEVVALE